MNCIIPLGKIQQQLSYMFDLYLVVVKLKVNSAVAYVLCNITISSLREVKCLWSSRNDLGYSGTNRISDVILFVYCCRLLKAEVKLRIVFNKRLVKGSNRYETDGLKSRIR